MPTWLVANFFYRFLSQALRRFALPLAVLFLLLHLPLAALVVSDLSGRFAEAGEPGASAIRWALGIVAVDLVLLAGPSAFLGRSLQRAVPVYGGPPAEQVAPAARAAAMTALLDRHAPNAQILLTGHTHQASLTPTPDGRVLVDAGCWVCALVPTRSWRGLPPVFAPTYPCTWAEVRPAPMGATVTEGISSALNRDFPSEGAGRVRSTGCFRHQNRCQVAVDPIQPFRVRTLSSSPLCRCNRCARW